MKNFSKCIIARSKIECDEQLEIYTEKNSSGKARFLLFIKGVPVGLLDLYETEGDTLNLSALIAVYSEMIDAQGEED